VFGRSWCKGGGAPARSVAEAADKAMMPESASCYAY
jgi:hypothetical protein